MSYTEIYACKKSEKKLVLISELKNSWLSTPVVAEYYKEKYNLEGTWTSPEFSKEFDVLFNSGELKDKDEYLAGLYYMELYMNHKVLKEFFEKLDKVADWADKQERPHHLKELKKILENLMDKYDYFLIESSLNCVSDELRNLINMESYLKSRNYQAIFKLKKDYPTYRIEDDGAMSDNMMTVKAGELYVYSGEEPIHANPDAIRIINKRTNGWLELYQEDFLEYFERVDNRKKWGKDGNN